jgi:polysaccharide export outer membrane protein
MNLKSSRIPALPLGSLALGTILVTTSLPLAVAFQASSVQARPVPRFEVAGQAMATTDAYILGPGDQIQLELIDPVMKDLGGTFDILNDGSAGLALLGSVVLKDLTLGQATQLLTRLYGRYLRRPDLSLRVLRARPIQVSVVGEVSSPGTYSLTPTEVSQTEGGRSTTISGLPTLVTAIQKAGGLTLNANLSDVVLRRSLPLDNNQQREQRLDLITLLKQGDKRQNPFLFDGDTIVIGKADELQADVVEFAASNLSPQEIQVNVVGEVVKPGRVQLRANTPVVQAILAAGGPVTYRSRRSDVELVRINRNGTATREVFRLDYSQGVSGAFNPPLRDGDTVIVNRSTYARVTDAIEAIATPLTPLVNVLALIDIIRNNN